MNSNEFITVPNQGNENNCPTSLSNIIIALVLFIIILIIIIKFL